MAPHDRIAAAAAEHGLPTPGLLLPRLPDPDAECAVFVLNGEVLPTDAASFFGDDWCKVWPVWRDFHLRLCPPAALDTGGLWTQPPDRLG